MELLKEVARRLGQVAEDAGKLVDPSNRLVAQTVETAWNGRVAELFSFA